MAVIGWTEEAEATLRRMWTAGTSASAIAAELTTPRWTVSRNAVLGKVHRLGLMATNKHGSNVKGGARPRQRRGPAPTAAPPKEPMMRMKPPAGPAQPPAPPPLPKLGDDDCVYEVSPSALCGSKVKKGKMFCPDHCAIVYVAPISKPRPPRRSDDYYGKGKW